jgi:hypothetical protein
MTYSYCLEQLRKLKDNHKYLSDSIRGMSLDSDSTIFKAMIERLGETQIIIHTLEQMLDRCDSNEYKELQDRARSTGNEDE